MSSTAGEIIVQAFREGNFVPIGHTSTAEELTEAIPRLNNLIFALFGNELGQEYRDWSVPNTWTAPQEQRHPLTPLTESVSSTPWAYPPHSSRLLVSVTTPRTLYFPAAPADGARMLFADIGSTANVTLHGNGRLIEGALSVVDTPAALDGRSWFYRADLANWIRLERITDAADELPFPEEFDDLFITGLCMRLGIRFGKPTDPRIEARYADMLARVVKRYREDSTPKSAAELRTILRTTP